jgi:hypothetical protein
MIIQPNHKSQGLGDTIAKITHKLKIDTVAEAVAKLAGAKGCGCEERKQYLNELFPYDNKTREFKVLKEFIFDEDTYHEYEAISVSKKDKIHQQIIQYVRDGYLEEMV